MIDNILQTAIVFFILGIIPPQMIKDPSDAPLWLQIFVATTLSVSTFTIITIILIKIWS